MVLLLSGWENINKKFTKQQVLLRTGGSLKNRNRAGFGLRGRLLTVCAKARPVVRRCAMVFQAARILSNKICNAWARWLIWFLIAGASCAAVQLWSGR